MRTKQINMSTMNGADCGRFGKALEQGITCSDRVKKQGATDWKHLSVAYEIKSGAGELNLTKDRQHIKGCKKILYVPVPMLNSDGTLSPERQEGFILDRDVFLELLKDVGLFRADKIKSDGNHTAAIQTFWNRKADKPTSIKKYNAFIDALYKQCEMTLEELLSE